jgi:predicted HAD superfamily Cof-like phosphohydrolase
LTYHLLVREFHEACDIAGNQPLSIAALKRRARLITEEALEFHSATEDLIAGGALPHLVANWLKELADVEYVTAGAIHEFGIPFDDVFYLVHRSNMSKLGPNGRALKREDGKILKGPHYRPPDLRAMVDVIDGGELDI